ncbi:MAG: fused MFS/spermidine synthase, partial [Myxococcales bacterium]|nr:fused MFS/spermidine synthase [Myxococcales bacterium]
MRRPAGSLFEVLFFLSGATALACEVVLSKLLSYVFGSSHLATSSVLAAYMAGLSAGAWFFGRVAARTRPIVLYAGLELAIGLFYLLLPEVYGRFQELALALGSTVASDARSLAWLRFGLSFGLVFTPTFLMGGTLPALIAAFRDVAPLDRSLSRLYAVNTLGAAAGAIVASYVSIPWLGLDGTMWVCAGVNTLVGLRAIVEHRRLAAHAPVPAVSPEEAPSSRVPGLSPRLAALIALGQGAISFSLQVVWFHLIGSVIGVTVYAFSLMLFAILLGIGAGSLLVPWLRKRLGVSTYALFTGALFMMALGVAGSLFLWDRFIHIIDMLPRLRGNYGAFFARELVRLGYCLLLLGPTTLAMGVSLPALAASVKSGDEPEARRVGRVFAANTLGTILGSIGTGFFLVGRLPSDTILRGAAVLLLALGVLSLWFGRTLGDRSGLRVQARTWLIAAAVTVSILAAVFPGFDIGRLTRGNHYYWWPSALLDRSPVAAMREDAQSGYVTVTRGTDGVRTLRTNGKYEGTDKQGEFQDLFALIGGLYLKKYDRAALVGVGPARTLRTLYEMPFKHIDAVEYSPGIVELARTEFAAFSERP